MTSVANKVLEVDDLNMMLDEIAQLEKGWMNGHGDPIKKELVEAVRKFLSRDEFNNPLVTVYVYPWESGGIGVEIEGPYGDLILTFNELDVIDGDGILCGEFILEL